MHGFNEEIGNSSTLFRPSWYSHTARAKVNKPVSGQPFPSVPDPLLFDPHGWGYVRSSFYCPFAGLECFTIFIGSCFCSTVPDPRIGTSEVQIRIRILLSDIQDSSLKNIFCLLLFEGTFESFFSDKKSF